MTGIVFSAFRIRSEYQMTPKQIIRGFMETYPKYIGRLTMYIIMTTASPVLSAYQLNNGNGEGEAMTDFVLHNDTDSKFAKDWDDGSPLNRRRIGRTSFTPKYCLVRPLLSPQVHDMGNMAAA